MMKFSVNGQFPHQEIQRKNLYFMWWMSHMSWLKSNCYKMAKHNLKILRCSHRKIIKACLAIFQHYAWEGRVEEMNVEFLTFHFSLGWLYDDFPKVFDRYLILFLYYSIFDLVLMQLCNICMYKYIYCLYFKSKKNVHTNVKPI